MHRRKNGEKEEEQNDFVVFTTEQRKNLSPKILPHICTSNNF